MTMHEPPLAACGESVRLLPVSVWALQSVWIVAWLPPVSVDEGLRWAVAGL